MNIKFFHPIKAEGEFVLLNPTLTASEKFSLGSVFFSQGGTGEEVEIALVIFLLKKHLCHNKELIICPDQVPFPKGIFYNQIASLQQEFFFNNAKFWRKKTFFPKTLFFTTKKNFVLCLVTSKR